MHLLGQLPGGHQHQGLSPTTIGPLDHSEYDAPQAEDREQGDGQRDAGAVDQTHPDVAGEAVGAEDEAAGLKMVCEPG